MASPGKERRRVGGIISTPLHSGEPGPTISAQAGSILRSNVNERSRAGDRGLRLRSPPAHPLQGDPEELPHPRRQVEGGHAP